MKTDFELSKKIVETFEASDENYSSVLPEVLNFISKDVSEKLEITNVTKPFLMIVLENICKEIKDSLDEESKMLYELMRLIVKTECVHMVVPSSMIKDGGDGGKGEKDEEKRE